MEKTFISTQAQLSAFSLSKEHDGTIPIYIEKPLHIESFEYASSFLKQIDWDFTNDDTRFLGHDLHPYPAKFIPQIPGTIISLLSSRGELVFDPFGGSGTTALESIRLGRRALSLDANPVAALIGRVKTARVESDALSELRSLHASLISLAGSMPKDPKELVDKYTPYAPCIANREKWFPDTSFGELANIRYKIDRMTDLVARDISLLALSRTVLGVSFQDSETRYKSVPREIPIGETTKKYIKEFELVMHSVSKNEAATRYGVSNFLVEDARYISAITIPDNSVDLIVTSPPYGNAMDYHLYHRFRLLWLGYDPIAFGKLEIGSHLKHQRESSGFDSYLKDMVTSLNGINRVLKNGRYAVLIIGDSIYNGETFNTAEILQEKAITLGFDGSYIIDRHIHSSKRSFTQAGRRASKESILFLRKTNHATACFFIPPPYKLWPYEKILQSREGSAPTIKPVNLNVKDLLFSRKFVFSHKIRNAVSQFEEPTWQAILENGMASNPSARKDPKYVTHGLHPYKGKFYPQLAKGLINIISLAEGSVILDPFCGSGTTLLEGYLNGYKSFGCDINPLAAKIAKVKSNILDEEPDVLSEVLAGILDAIDKEPNKVSTNLDQFSNDCIEEIERWFAHPIAEKVNWLLSIIRSRSEGVSRDFLEVVLSSIIRDISNQEPTDLRIRYRKNILADADVFGLFKEQLVTQYSRIEKFWKVRGYSPNPFFTSSAISGDNRINKTYDSLGLQDHTVDLVLTSPPYAMALPYIDTDRLSLLTLFGLGSGNRRTIEQALIGSRELSNGIKKELEENFLKSNSLPISCQNFVLGLYKQIENSKDSGFRKKNMPALVHRFLKDMDLVFVQLSRLCKSGAEAMVVIGDSKMSIDNKIVRIPTTSLVESIAQTHGFIPIEKIDISVTTENLIHIKNAITENVVLRLIKLH